MTRDREEHLNLTDKSLFEEGKLKISFLEDIISKSDIFGDIRLVIDEDGYVLEDFSWVREGKPEKERFKDIPFDRKGLIIIRQAETLKKEDQLLFFELQPAWLLLVITEEENLSFYLIQQKIKNNSLETQELGPLSAEQIKDFDFFSDMKKLLARLVDVLAKEEAERVITAFGYQREEEIDLRELASLVQTAGGQVVASTTQRIVKPDPRYYLGSGKINELSELVEEYDGDLVIFDNALTPVQQRNIQSVLGVQVIDRNQLILDIFAANARTREGQVQVELAQLSYLLPRLVGYRPELSRLGGGIGTRGPGETKLETDRRRIRRRILELKRNLEQIKKQRQTMQKNRILPLVTLVGYTNSGKSTLLNSLTGANVVAVDRLFATLDPTVRRCRLLDGRWVLLTDTVGFIKNIPHDLIAAFRATLEGVEQGDLLLHVVDVSQPRFEEQVETVLSVLEDLDVTDKPIITVFNKIDLHPDKDNLKSLLGRYEPAVLISAHKKENLAELLEMVGEFLAEKMELANLLIPYGQGKLLEEFHNRALVVHEEYEQEGIKVQVYISSDLLEELKGSYSFS